MKHTGNVRFWPIASFRCEAEVGRDQRIADIASFPATATTDFLVADVLHRCGRAVPAPFTRSEEP
jgi:hypothetical protein